jgi:hypothetical protein
MVSWFQVGVLMILVQQDAPTFEDLFPQTPPPPIVAARKVGISETVIKPCQSVTVVFEVTLAEGAVRTQWPKVAREVSELLRVNGEEYWNRLSGSGSTNTACEFDLLWPQPIGREPPLRSSDRALIAATCQVDLKEKVCLFREPGEYTMEFFFGEHRLTARVHVEPPTPTERRIIDKLSTVEMFLLLLDPTERQYATAENISLLEELASLDSAYANMFSLTLAIAKRHRDPERWVNMTDEQKRKDYREQYRLLIPILTEELDSRVKALAAAQMAHAAGQLAKLEDDPHKRAEFDDIRWRLLERLSECPLVPSEQALAQEALRSRASIAKRIDEKP